MQSESELWRHPNERPFWSILVLPIVSSSLKYQKKDWNEVITCNFEVFWLLRNELLLHCTDQKGQTLFFFVCPCLSSLYLLSSQHLLSSQPAPL